MMNIAVLYRSMTGHSKKIAKAIASAHGVTAQNIKDNPNLNNVDLLFFAGGIYSGKSLPDALAYFNMLKPENAKKAALITSSATHKNSQDEIREILTANNVEVITEEYRCLGNFLFIKMGHPNKSEIAGAVKFAEDLISKLNQSENIG